MSLLSAIIIIWLHHLASPTACIKEHKKKDKIKTEIHERKNICSNVEIQLGITVTKIESDKELCVFQLITLLIVFLFK